MNVHLILMLRIMRFKILTYCIISFLVAPILAQQPEYTRHIVKVFPAGKSHIVEVNNKYGRVQVIPWSKDSVKIDIDLRIRAKDKRKLNKMKDDMDFEFVSTSSFIRAETKIGNNNSDIFRDLVDIAGSYFSSANSVAVNYTISLPDYLTIKIENKFGDVYFDHHTGNINLQLSYGDLKAGRLNGNNAIRITSGDGDINYLHKGTVYVSYGNLHIKEAREISTETRSSNITVERAENMKIDSRRDKLFISEAKSLSGECYFSDMIVNRLTHGADLSGRYGDISIDNISRTFELISLTSTLTDLSLGFEKPLAFNFEMNHLQDILFVYPETDSKLSTSLVNADSKIYRTSGSFGSRANSSRVVINALRKCTLTIFSK